MNEDTPQDGWWPEEVNAPMTQMLFRNGKPIANIIKQSVGWRSFSTIELNKSGTTGKPLSDAGSVETRQEAQKQAEDYAKEVSDAAEKWNV